MSSVSKPLLLVYAGLRSVGQSSNEGLPSWVPDWRLPVIRKLLVTSGLEKELRFLDTINFLPQAPATQPKHRRPAGSLKLKPLGTRCDECEANLKNDIELRFRRGSFLGRFEWVGETFTKPLTPLSIAAWVHRSIRDLAAQMQDTGFEGHKYCARMLGPILRAVHALRHVLVLAFDLQREEDIGDLWRWLGELFANTA